MTNFYLFLVRNSLIICIILAVSLESVLGVNKDLWCYDYPPDEYVLLPHDFNCNMYYECHMNEIEEYECPPGLQYNPKEQACDFKENVQCVDVEDMCSDAVEYFPHPYSCSLYIECFHYAAYLMTCPRNMWFDNEEQKCVLAEGECDKHVTIPTPDPVTTESTTKPITTESPTTEAPITETTTTQRPTTETSTTEASTTETTTTQRPTTKTPTEPEPTTVPWTTPHPICFGVRPGQIVLFPNPEDCSKYYRCDGANLSEDQCSGNLLFNEEKQICDLPSLVDCKGRPSPTTPEYPTTTDVTPTFPPHYNDPRCADGDTTFLPDYDDCQKYILCFEGHGYIIECPDGMFYDEYLDKCVKSSESSCGKTTAPTMPTPTSLLPPHPDCQYDGQLLPYPGDCTKFYECEYGQKVEMSCPAGLWFNVEINECDYPYHTQCADGF